MKVYFNNWFSSINDIIADIKKTHGDGIEIIGSSHNPNHVMSAVVDEFFVEDWEDKKISFMEWLLPFLNEQRTDIFFVKKHVEEVLKNKEFIEQAGVKIIADDLETYRLADDKAMTYEVLKGVTAIPEYIKSGRISDIEDFINTHEACLKLNNGEGGESYKRIVDSPKSLMELQYGRHNQITKDEIGKILETATPEQLDKFIFMEYLDAPEISADCYDSKQGFICICRDKIGGTRAERIYYSEQIANECEKIKNALNLKHPFNVQFRLKKGLPHYDFANYRLLEINPRISGGSYYLTLIGRNLCNVCLCDAAGIEDGYDIDDYIDFNERIVSHVERPVLID